EERRRKRHPGISHAAPHIAIARRKTRVNALMAHAGYAARQPDCRKIRCESQKANGSAAVCQPYLGSGRHETVIRRRPDHGCLGRPETQSRLLSMTAPLARMRTRERCQHESPSEY